MTDEKRAIEAAINFAYRETDRNSLSVGDLVIAKGHSVIQKIISIEGDQAQISDRQTLALVPLSDLALLKLAEMQLLINGRSSCNHRKLNDIFHSLWTKAVGQDRYDKKEWQEFRELLKKNGIDV